LLTGDVTAADALILDVDQVLLDTRPSFYAAAQRVVEQHGGTLSSADIEVFKQAGGFNDDWHMARAAVAVSHWRRQTDRTDALATLLTPDAGLEGVLSWAPDPGPLRQACEEAYWELAHREVVLVDVDLLRALNDAGVRTFACTGRNRREAQSAFDRLGWTPERLTTMEDALKPDPTALLRLLDGIASAWFAGDSIDDQRCAQAVRPLTDSTVRFVRVVEDKQSLPEADAVSVGINPFLERFLETCHA